MNKISAGLASSCEFIEEWLHHFNLHYEKDNELQNKQLSYYLPEHNTGIIIPGNEKAINVPQINKALKILDSFSLQELIIVGHKISDNAYDTINRLSVNLSVVHPNGLSELALKFINYSKLNIAQVS